MARKHPNLEQRGNTYYYRYTLGGRGGPCLVRLSLKTTDYDAAALVIIIGHWYIAFATVPVGIFFYAFEVLLVCTLQAFIFAILSGIYIGFAVEPPH